MFQSACIYWRFTMFTKFKIFFFMALKHSTKLPQQGVKYRKLPLVLCYYKAFSRCVPGIPCHIYCWCSVCCVVFPLRFPYHSNYSPGAIASVLRVCCVNYVINVNYIGIPPCTPTLAPLGYVPPPLFWLWLSHVSPALIFPPIKPPYPPLVLRRYYCRKKIVL